MSKTRDQLTDRVKNAPVKWRDLADCMDLIAVELAERIRELQASVDAFSASTGRYAGVWQRSVDYSRGAMVTDRGTLWFCVKETTERPGETDSWQLMVKSDR